MGPAPPDSPPLLERPPRELSFFAFTPHQPGSHRPSVFSTAAAFAAAAPERVSKAQAAMYGTRARCAELGVESAAVQQQLFTTMVTPILTYGAEVWAPQLIPKAARASHTGGGSKSEQLQIRYLRHLLGVRHNTPVAAILAETGELPLWIRWLEQAVRLWNHAADEPEDSLVRIALAANTHLALHSPAAQLARQTWSRQLASSLSILGLELDLAAPAPIPIADLHTTTLAHHLSLCTTASLAAGATMFRYYFQEVCGGELTPDTYGPARAPAPGRGAAAAAPPPFAAPSPLLPAPPSPPDALRACWRPTNQTWG